VIQARLCVGSPYRDGRAERPATSSAKAPEPAPVLAACVSCGEQVDLAAIYKHWQKRSPDTLGAERAAALGRMTRIRPLWALRGYIGAPRPPRRKGKN
jgi:hypothetical protein